MSQLSSPQKAQNPVDLHHLGYVSTETVKFSKEALVALLSEARNANADRESLSRNSSMSLIIFYLFPPHR